MTGVVADLHTHLPMRIEPTVKSGTFADRLGLIRDRWRYAVVSAAGRFGNLEGATGRHVFRSPCCARAVSA